MNIFDLRHVAFASWKLFSADYPISFYLLAAIVNIEVVNTTILCSCVFTCVSHAYGSKWMNRSYFAENSFSRIHYTLHVWMDGKHIFEAIREWKIQRDENNKKKGKKSFRSSIKMESIHIGRNRIHLIHTSKMNTSFQPYFSWVFFLFLQSNKNGLRWWESNTTTEYTTSLMLVKGFR